MATKGSDLLLAFNMLLKEQQQDKDREVDKTLAIMNTEMQRQFTAEQNELTRLSNVYNDQLIHSKDKLNRLDTDLSDSIDALEDLTGSLFKVGDENKTDGSSNVVKDITGSSIDILKQDIIDLDNEIKNKQTSINEVKQLSKESKVISDYYMGLGSDFKAGIDPERWDEEDFNIDNLNNILKQRFRKDRIIKDSNAFLQGAADKGQAKLNQQIIDLNAILDQARTAEYQADVVKLERDATVKWNDATEVRKEQAYISGEFGVTIAQNVAAIENSLASVIVAQGNVINARDQEVSSSKSQDDIDKEVVVSQEAYEVALNEYGAGITGDINDIEGNIMIAKLAMNAQNDFNESRLIIQKDPSHITNSNAFVEFIELIDIMLIENDKTLGEITEPSDDDIKNHAYRERMLLSAVGISDFEKGQEYLSSILQAGQIINKKITDLSIKNLEGFTNVPFETLPIADPMDRYTGVVDTTTFDPYGDNTLTNDYNITDDLSIGGALKVDDSDYLGGFESNKESVEDLQLFQFTVSQEHGNKDISGGTKSGPRRYSFETSVEDIAGFRESLPLVGGGATLGSYTGLAEGDNISNERRSIQFNFAEGVQMFNDSSKISISNKWLDNYTVSESRLNGATYSNFNNLIDGLPESIKEIYDWHDEVEIDFNAVSFKRPSTEHQYQDGYVPTIEANYKKNGSSSTIPAGKLSVLNYVPTADQQVIMQGNVDKLIDTILEEFEMNKDFREGPDGLYEVTYSKTLRDHPMFSRLFGSTLEDTEHGEFTISESQKVIVNLEKITGKFFNDMSQYRTVQDNMWRDKLHFDGVTRNELPEELKYLLNEPKGYHHWEPFKQVEWRNWKSFTKDRKDDWGSFENYYKSVLIKSREDNSEPKDMGMDQKLNVYESLNKLS